MSPTNIQKQKKDVENLYERGVKSTRGGNLFNAHSYPTKINYSAILPFIAIHTEPGDVVFDGFAGTGSTGIATLMCENPPQEIKNELENEFESINWGKRKCHLYDVSVLATKISQILTDPPDAEEFREAADEVLNELENEWSWMYKTKGPENKEGKIRYTIWSEFIECENCQANYSYWDLAVDLDGPEMKEFTECPNCGEELDLSDASRVKENKFDELLDEERHTRKREPVFVYGRSGRNYWRRPINKSDLELVKKIHDQDIPDSVPVVQMMKKSTDKWGELHRAGYHYGISHLHHFYTRRNLIAIGKAWELTSNYPSKIKEALRFWISSYNTTHSTLMTRVVCKKSSDDLVPTSAQPASLYISSLPVEKNVFSGLSRKRNRIGKAFEETHKYETEVKVQAKSSLNVDLEDESVDYIFTDPPFGNNIQYSEVNFLNEAWWGEFTEQEEEAIVSPHQEKSVDDYKALLAGSLSEANRILKEEGTISVVFQSTRSSHWEALKKAWQSAGFQMVDASFLDKTQGSFKQVTTDGAIQGDAVIMLEKAHNLESEKAKSNGEVEINNLVQERLKTIENNKLSENERTKERLYCHYINRCLEKDTKISISADKFFSVLEEEFKKRQKKYFRP